jgi:hypothetical protein
MGIFYQQYLDCGRQFSDFYDNTPHVSQARNAAPRIINLRWSGELDPSRAVVEFFNYWSILPAQQARTFTTRGSFGLYPVSSPNMVIPLTAQVLVPGYATSFRIRLDKNGPLVTNQVPINNNDLYMYESGRIHRVYNF